MESVDPVRAAQVIGVFRDIFDNFTRFVIFADKSTYATEGKKGFQEKVVPHLKKLDFIVGGSTYAAGNTVSFADFPVYELEDTLRAFDEETFNQYPNLKKHFEAFSEVPQIKAYRASDRFLAKPFFPPHVANWSGL